MPIKINYIKTNKKKSKLTNTILFSKEKFKINNLRNYLSKSEFAYIEDIIKTIDLKKIYLYLSCLLKEKLF